MSQLTTSQLAASQLTIAKFGGTSVADADTMQCCANLILDNPSVRLVVLSASAGVTNALIALAAGETPDNREALIEQIRHIQYAIIDKIAPQPAVCEEIEQILKNISTLAEAASLATSLALTDELMSHGELMSTLLFTELLRQQNSNVEWFDIRSIMHTDANFGKASPNITLLGELARQHLQPRLQSTLVITQGFIGRDTNSGRTTTLGRGGSDYTAALLSEALNAERIDIWTDVPGIYTTDPRITSAACRIDEISFSEAAEMATFGAKILHPATLLPAVRCNIPVFVGSSKMPAAGGTLVCSHTQQQPLFRALALRRQQTLVTLHSLNMLHAHGFLAEVFGILARHHISVDLITTSEVSIALTLDKTSLPTGSQNLISEQLLSELSVLCTVNIEEELALVALIGNNLSQVNGVGKKVFSTLDNLNVRMICYGASTHNLCFLVPGSDAEEVVCKLHKQLFEQ